MTVTLHRRIPEFEPDAPFLSPSGFVEALGNHAAGVALVTADSPDGPVAVVTTRIVQLSTAPPLLGICLTGRRADEDSVLSSTSIVLHVLTAEDLELVHLLSKNPRADGLDWRRLHTGEPVISTVAAWIRAEVVERIETGDSTLVVARPTIASYPPAAMTKLEHWPGPLVRQRNDLHRLGSQSRLG
jgi:flavin reductase (DIM6/NTAB) family NADH-FMN oxidoreductase RutF